MKKIKLGSSNLEVPSIAVGCMRLSSLTIEEAEKFILTCQEEGANFFDHADIYGQGECESLFGKVLQRNRGLRKELFIQSKCGIVPGKMYDFSKEHIIKSVDESLKRLQTDHLELLALHRPDALMEPEEVAFAFEQLKKQGKVQYFGVSNMNPMQIELLKKFLTVPILVNQLQFSAPVSNMIASGLEVNMTTEGSMNRDGGVLDYCRLHNVTIQAWSPFQRPNWQGVFLDCKEYEKLNQVLETIAIKYGASKTMIATAWILRHPANMQVIAGTTKVDRMKEILEASKICLTRSEWYQIYLSAGHPLP